MVSPTSDKSDLAEKGRTLLHKSVMLAGNGLRTARAAIETADRGVQRYWATRSLAQQFALVSAAVLIAGMTVLGLWVSERIKQGIMHNSAASGVLLMDNYIAPMVQELATGDEISPARREALDRLLKQSAIGDRVAAIKIWRVDGTVAYSNWHDQIGKKYKPTPNFKRALGGAISAEFEGQYHEQDAHERALQVPLLEIYAPIRERNSERIIAISEFYERGADVKAVLAQAEAMTWIVVAVVTVLMMAALSGVVARGSRTIDDQRNRLKSQVVELRSLLDQNHELSQRVQRASNRTAVINERLLRRVGADLHDGPAQLLSLALLRLDFLTPLAESRDCANAQPAAQKIGGAQAPSAKNELEKIRGSLQEAMKELRDISAGLALPELSRASLTEVVQMAVRAHERKTETRVAADVMLLPGAVPDELKTCVYRFVQEGLNNAFRHAGGAGQHVAAKVDGSLVSIAVSDSGPGFSLKSPVSGKTSTLGLSGMRDRIESLGGTMETGGGSERGGRVVAHFDLNTLLVTDEQNG